MRWTEGISGQYFTENILIVTLENPIYESNISRILIVLGLTGKKGIHGSFSTTLLNYVSF